MATKSTKSQKDLFFAKLAQQQEAQAAEQFHTTGSTIRNNNADDKTTGVFVNQGVYHPTLGVIALSYGVDAGYIARKPMKFSNTSGELSEGQQALAARQAISQAYTGMIQDLAQDMLIDGIRDLDITPENIAQITENTVLINLFTKCQLGVTLVNTNVERVDNVEINQDNIADLFA